jgi:MFS family permease
VFALAAAAGRFSGHLLAARATPAVLFGTGAALAAAGSVVAALAPNTAGVLAGIAVAGLGTSICAPTLIAIAGLPRYGRQGAATSTVITIAYLGFAVGPAAIGLVAGATTLPTALAAVAAIAGALALTSPVLTRLSADLQAPPAEAESSGWRESRPPGRTPP